MSSSQSLVNRERRMILEGNSTPEAAPAVDVEAILPLSPLQEGILFHSIDSRGCDPFLVQLCYSLSGDLAVPALRAAWEAAVRRHSALRTVFVWERRDRPLQVVRRNPPLVWERHDWRAHSPAESAERLQSFLQAERVQGFHLANSPPIRISLIATGDRAYRLVVTYHHIILDGWSLAIVWRQVVAAYEAGGRISADPVANPQYRDYVAWLGRQDPAAAERFWRRTLRGFRAPALFQSSPVEAATSEFSDLEVRLSATETAVATGFARTHHLTVNTLIQAANPLSDF